MDDAQLQTIWQQRRMDQPVTHLGESLALLMTQTLAKKVRQLAELSAVWDEVIPEEIASHTALESFNRGTLTVRVDSAPHRFQLQTLLNGGLRRALQARFSGAINRIRLVPGQFYSVDVNGAARYEV